MNENWKRVIATHEEAQTLSTGPWLGDSYPGVALPCRAALGKWIVVRFEDKWTPARVMDVGPWCEDDDLYVFGGHRPRAERLKGEIVPIQITNPISLSSKVSNGAGIDLFPGTAKALGIDIGDNVQLDWRFLEL